MSDKPWYKEWFNSPYYHLLYFNRDEAEAKRFIEELVKRLKPTAGARMLDVACGRGRHSKILASLGFDVTGIDLAPDSIKIAKENERENLHFFLHDMRLPYSVNYFDYAFNFFTSFGYFRSRRENENAVRTVADALKHGEPLYWIISTCNTPNLTSRPGNRPRLMGSNSFSAGGSMKIIFIRRSKWKMRTGLNHTSSLNRFANSA